MSGRTTQSIGRGITAYEDLRTGNGALRRPIGGPPRMLTDRAAAVSQIASGLSKNASQGVRLTHEDVRHHLIAPILRDLLPAGMSLLKKAQIGDAMDRTECLEPCVLRNFDCETQIASCLEQVLGPLRDLLRRAHLAS